MGNRAFYWIVLPVFLDEGTKSRLEPIFASLVNPVKLVFFRQKDACSSCIEQEKLLRDLSDLSGKVTLEVYDFILNGDEVMNFKIDKIPATAVVGKRDFGIRFYGVTGGYEFMSLLEDIVMVSTDRTGLDPRLEILVKSIASSVHLQVLVNLTCPHCAKMVHAAHQFAFANSGIRADMVELTEFPYIAQKYSVTGVPKTIIDEGHSVIGEVPPETLYLEIRKTASS